MMKKILVRVIMNVQFFIGERYPLNIYCDGIKNLQHKFENLFHITKIEVKMLLGMAL